MTDRSPPALGTLLTGLACLLAGCSARTNVSLTGNTPAKYSHVWITTQEVWVNTSASAGPDGSGWHKFSLSTPATVDLVAQNGGTLGSIVTGLSVEPGTYAQLRLIPLDPSAALTSSAKTAGALFNAEADYVDGGGTTHQLPLEMLNPEKGIGIATSLRVPVGNVGAALSGTGIGNSNATSSSDAAFVSASNPFPTTVTGSNGTTTGTTTATSSGTTSFGISSTTTGTTGRAAAAAATPNEFAVSIDGTRDLVPFTFGAATPAPGIMLSSHAAAFDLTRVGAISGTLTLTGLSNVSGLQASAEVLSADGSRHVVVSSTPVHADGSFMLYPLAAGSDSSSPDDYDVVIHGPGIATIIIKGVQVFLASTSSTATTNSTSASMSTSSTTSASTGTTTITPVSIGTLVPRAAASYSAQLTAGSTPLPAGAAVSFYQTLARKGEVPYVIEVSPIDPFNQVLGSPQMLSSGTVDSGTWSSTGAAINVVSAAPAEGAGGYTVAGTAASFADGALSTKIAAPASSSTTPVQVPALPAMKFASGVTQGSIAATVTQVTPNKYDQGELLVTHNGTLVASAPLDAVIKAGGGTVTLNTVPAGTPDAVYYVAWRAWRSSDPAGSLVRESVVTGALDMSSSPSGALQLSVN